MSKSVFCPHCDRILGAQEIDVAKLYKLLCANCGTTITESESTTNISIEALNALDIAKIEDYMIEYELGEQERSVQKRNHMETIIWETLNEHGNMIRFDYDQQRPGYVGIGLESQTLPYGLLTDKESVQSIADSLGLQIDNRKINNFMTNEVTHYWRGIMVLKLSHLRPPLVAGTLKLIESLMNELLLAASKPN